MSRAHRVNVTTQEGQMMTAETAAVTNTAELIIVTIGVSRKDIL